MRLLTVKLTQLSSVASGAHVTVVQFAASTGSLNPLFVDGTVVYNWEHGASFSLTGGVKKYF